MSDIEAEWCALQLEEEATITKHARVGSRHTTTSKRKHRCSITALSIMATDVVIEVSDGEEEVTTNKRRKKLTIEVNRKTPTWESRVGSSPSPLSLSRAMATHLMICE